VKFTALHLRNTPAVCRKCYIHPAVLEQYLESGSLKARKSRSISALHPEERFAVDLLSQQRKDA
jgi:DNA topoisomerase-1